MSKDYDSYERGEIASNLRLMYQAARDDYPDRASDVAAVASMVRSLVTATDQVAALVGDPTVLRDTVGVCADVLDALVSTANTLNDAAVGIKHVADHFAATDDFAGQVYRQLGSKVTDFTPAQAKVPAGVDSTHAQLPGDAQGNPSTPSVQSAGSDLNTRNGQLQHDQGEIDTHGLGVYAGGDR